MRSALFPISSRLAVPRGRQHALTANGSWRGGSFMPDEKTPEPLPLVERKPDPLPFVQHPPGAAPIPVRPDSRDWLSRHPRVLISLGLVVVALFVIVSAVNQQTKLTENAGNLTRTKPQVTTVPNTPEVQTKEATEYQPQWIYDNHED